MATFIYKGDASALLALGHKLTKDEPFTTEEYDVIALLSATLDVEEVKEQIKEKKEVKKPTRVSDAVES